MNRPVLSFVVTAVALALFIFLCTASAADSQGGSIIFFLLGPILFGVQAVALLLSWKERAGSRRAKAAHWLGAAMGMFYFGFYFSLFTPGLQGFPKAVVGLTSSTSISVSDRRTDGDHAVPVQIHPKQVQQVGGKPCDFFAETHLVALVTKENALQRIEILFEGGISLIEMGEGKEAFNAVYAHDLDSGASVSVKYEGSRARDAFKGTGAVQIKDKNSSCKVEFTFEEAIR